MFVGCSCFVVMKVGWNNIDIHFYICKFNIPYILLSKYRNIYCNVILVNYLSNNMFLYNYL